MTASGSRSLGQRPEARAAKGARADAAEGAVGSSKPRRTTRPKGAAAAVASPQQRSSAYRGVSREEAAAAYHVDARVMARMGYVPQSEDWTTQLEQILVVGYVHAPERAPAVLSALEAAEAEVAAKGPSALVPEPALPAETGRAPRWRPHQMALEVRLALGTLVGTLAGIAIGLVLGVASGEASDGLVLGGFGMLGMVFGLMFGVAGDDG